MKQQLKEEDLDFSDNRDRVEDGDGSQIGVELTRLRDIPPSFRSRNLPLLLSLYSPLLCPSEPAYPQVCCTKGPDVLRHIPKADGGFSELILQPGLTLRARF